MNEFIIVFRECLEASLIVGIIYSFLSRSNLHDALKKLWLGVGASVIASIFVAIFVVYLKSTVGDTRYEKLFEALFMYAAAGLIWYVVFWLSKHVSDRKDLESKTETALKMSSWGVFWVVFFSILREGFETVIMLLAQDRGCLLYTSDAADEEDSVDLGGRRIIKKNINRNLATKYIRIL